jgi:hypothetical protein
MVAPVESGLAGEVASPRRRRGICAQARGLGSNAVQLEGHVPRHRCLRGQRLKNAKLKKLLAEQMLDAAALRELLAKKWQGALSSAHQAVMGLSERRSARLSDRKMIHYRSCRPLGRSCAISPTRGNIEYRRLFVVLRHEGDPWASTASRGLFAKKALRRPGDGLGGAPWDRGRRSWLISSERRCSVDSRP